MGYEINAQMLFSDTLVPDVFIKEYLPALDGDSLKVYVYCLFLNGRSECTIDVLKKILGFEDEVLRNCLNQLTNGGLITVKTRKIVICDIKEKELNKYYKPRAMNEGAEESGSRSQTVRSGVIKHISDRFFSGQMAPSWYYEIDMWFEKYSFDDDVMFMLFQHCSDRLAKSGKTLNKAYINTVANSWNTKGIRTSDDLEKHLAEYEKYKGVKAGVVKKLRMAGNLTEYEEKVIEKWFFDYKFTFDIIELALKRSVNSRNASLATYDRFLSEWFSKGLRTSDQITRYEEDKKQQYKDKKNYEAGKNTASVPQRNYEDQRKYDDDFFNSLDEKIEKA